MISMKRLKHMVSIASSIAEEADLGEIALFFYAHPAGKEQVANSHPQSDGLTKAKGCDGPNHCTACPPHKAPPLGPLE